MATNARRQVSIFVNGEQVEATAKNISGAYKKASNELATMVVGSDKYIAKLEEVRNLDGILRKHRDAIRGVEQGWSLTKIGVDKFVGVAAGAFAVDSLLSYGKQLYGVGIQMDTLNRKAATVFGSTLPRVTAEAEKNAKAMGLTTAEYVNAAAAIQDILIPMGFQRKEASNISTELVNLSGALAEWSGGQVSAKQVSDILSSALTGEREQLKSLGIVLQQADIDARLAEKGLDKLTGTTRQQAEASATLELILEKSTDAQAAFATGTGSAIRNQAELAAKTQEVVEKLSTLLLPVFAKLAEVAGVVVDAIGGVVGVIGDMVNPTAAATKAFDDQAAKVADLENNINPLLDRYDELAGKANLNAAEQDELQKIITTVAGVVPQAVTEFDKYGKAVGVNTDKVREFIEVEKARLKFVNESAIKQNEELKKSLELDQKYIQQQLNSRKKFDAAGGGPGGVPRERNLTSDELKALQVEAANLQQRLSGVNAEVARLRGETLTTPTATDGTPESPKGGGGGKDAAKEAERLQKQLTDLIESVTQKRRDLLAKEQEDELDIVINGIEDRYNKEIEKAIELEKKGVQEATAQRIALEELKQNEIGLAVAEYTAKSVEEAEKQAYDNQKKIAEAELKAYEETEAFKAEREKGRQEATAQIKDFENAAFLEQQELELLQLKEHYNKLLLLAEEYGLNKAAITAAYEAANNKIVKDSTERQRKYEEDLAKAKFDLKIAEYNALENGAAILRGFFESQSVIAKALFLFEKIATAQVVLLNAQKEKAAIYAATRLGTLFDPTGALGAALAAPQIVAVNIRTGISLATIAATALKDIAIPKVQQKAGGGFLSVTGADDGRTYNASVMPTPHTGLLPDYPVLFQSNATGQPVLASERGAEYFVSADALRNPYVANLTRMIDNIAGGRVAQFAEGGANVPTQPAAPPPQMDMAVLRELTGVLASLQKQLAGGIVAVIPDRTLAAIPDRFGKINDVAGGYFG